MLIMSSQSGCRLLIDYLAFARFGFRVYSVLLTLGGAFLSGIFSQGINVTSSVSDPESPDLVLGFLKLEPPSHRALLLPNPTPWPETTNAFCEGSGFPGPLYDCPVLGDSTAVIPLHIVIHENTQI